MRISLLERNGFKLGDKVEVIRSNSDDCGKIGIIKFIRNSYCSIDCNRYKQNGEPWYYNHPYGDFIAYKGYSTVED